MKILVIRGRNIASLAEPFEVDLLAPPLGGCGVFALSGPTGAGKSSILDAMCLALYGSTPRLGRAQKVAVPDPSGQVVLADAAAQLLRRGSGSGFAEVEFIGIDGVTYRARYSLRRANERPNGRPQPPTHELFLRDAARPLGGKNSETAALIAEKLGLDWKQFTRAVLLAQNDFAAFLSSNAEERASLLERLTGTEHFGELSTRIFERAKRERSALDVLDAELATAPVLDAEDLRNLELRIAESSQALAALERKETAARAMLQFSNRLEELARAVAAARDELASAEGDSTALDPERIELARLRLVLLEAKELVLAVQRGHMKRLQLETERSDCARRVLEAVKELDEQRATEGIAAATLERLRGRELELQPLLRRALLLDEALTRAQAALGRARSELEVATKRHASVRDAAIQSRQRLDAVGTELNAIVAFMTANAGLARLSEDWPSKREALVRAARRLAEIASCVDRLAKSREQYEAGHAARLTRAQELDGLRARVTELSTRADVLRDQAAGDDLELLETAERDAERWLSRHDDFARGLREFAEKQRERVGLEEQENGLRARRDELRGRATSGERLVEERRQQLLLGSAELQAAQRMAEESVEALRACLRSGEPCPVCGSAEHPFGGDAAAEVTQRLRLRLAPLREAAAHAQAELASAERDQAAVRAEQARVEGQLVLTEQLLRSWEQQIEVTTQRVSAFEAELRSLLASVADSTVPHASQSPEVSRALGQAASAAATATAPARVVIEGAPPIADELGVLVLDGAITRLLDERRGDLVGALERAGQARMEAKQRQQDAEAARNVADAARAAFVSAEQELRTMERALDELERKLSADAEQSRRLELEQEYDLAPFVANPCFPDWRTRWDVDPRSCFRATEAAVAAWQTRAAQRASLEQEQAVLVAQLPDLEARVVETSEALGLSELQLSAASKALDELATDRAALLDGRSIEDVETELRAQVNTAVSNLDAARALRAASEQALAIAQSRLDTAQGSLGAVMVELANDDAELDRWLEGQRGSGSDPTIARGELSVMVEQGPAKMAAIEAHLESTRAALDQARGRLEHAVSAHAEQLAKGDEVAQALRSAFGDELDSSSVPLDGSAASSLVAEVCASREARRGELAELVARRRSDQELRARIGLRREQREQQYARTEKWQLLCNLIGSADGKRLRHLAQEVTLDLVLAHANRHLQDLARRYRLDRLPEGLNIVVIDEELLGGRRGIASLSGGETFLVSLALALGLATLSAEKVRVETLFIDEGFGSLDQATLQIAVAALDRVQAEGRQVGVVSHVGDLAERLGLEVCVEPAGGGKSRVRVRERQVA